MEINKLDIDTEIYKQKDDRADAPKELTLPRSIWGKIFEYLSVNDECRFRQCGYWTNILLSNIGLKSRLSVKKIKSLFVNKFLQAFKLENGEYNIREYEQSWFNRISEIFAKDLPWGPLDRENIHKLFPNLEMVYFNEDDVASFFNKGSKFFFKKEVNKNTDSQTIAASQKVIDRRINLVFEKSSLYHFESVHLKNLFEIFPCCSEILFTSLEDEQKNKMNVCQRMKLVPHEIMELCSDVIYNTEKCKIVDLQKLISEKKKEDQQIVKKLFSENFSSYRFLLNYFFITANVVEVEDPFLNDFRECESKAIREGCMIAMYNRFINDNHLPDTLTCYSETDWTVRYLYQKDPYCLNYIAQKIETLKKYQLLVDAVGMEFPPAQYLFGRIELAKDANQRIFNFQSPKIYIERSAKAGFSPACQFLRYLQEEEKLRMIKKEESKQRLQEESTQGSNKKPRN